MFQLQGRIQHYAWGSQTAIPQILGTPLTGEPQAEYWLGTHASAPSTIKGNGELQRYLDLHPDALGEASLDAFGPGLPYLLKVLAADQPLSLQAHPSREQAEDGFARENAAGVALDAPERTYKDAWPKPELLVALTPFAALNGFREPTESAELFQGLGVWKPLFTLLGPLVNRRGAAAIAEVFLEALTAGPQQQEYTLETVAAARRYANDTGELGSFSRTALELNTYYPGDPSILGALLCNRIDLIPGQAMYLPVGNMHAYLHGTAIEVMANSDNVVRGALTPKHIDVPELVKVVTFEAEEPRLVHVRDVAPGVRHYPTDAREFSLWQLVVRPDQPVEAPAPDGARIALVLEGELTTAEGMTLRTGDAVFAAAGERLCLLGEGMAVMAAPGVAAER